MDKPITRPQQNAIHLYFELLAEALNDAGHGMKDVMLGGQLQLFIELYKRCYTLLSSEEVVSSDQSFEMKQVSYILEKINIEKLERDIPCTKENIKENIWKPIQKAMYQEEKTSKLKKTQISSVYDVVDRFTSEKFGVHIEFPSEETLYQGEQR